MDCFFASVAELTHPALRGQPLAVSHSNSTQGTGEVSSANYVARGFGIRAGMFIAEAKRRCPSLVVMPYTFDKFEEISEQVRGRLGADLAGDGPDAGRVAGCVQAVTPKQARIALLLNA